jgi:RNA polymerase sigma-70 factor (ECF subfamily)
MVDAFVARLAPELRDAAHVPELEAELAALIDRAREEAPGVELDPVAFAAHVGERVTFDRAGRANLDAVRAGALWIAFGCGIGDAAAITAFEATYAKAIGSALRRSFDPGLCEDAELRLRERLFLVAGDQVPRLESYSGRGDLHAWLRAAAVRTAIDLMRAQRMVPVGAVPIDDGAAIDPLLAALKQRYRDEFRDAFAEVAAALTDRERTLLRYHYFDGLSIDEIGALYRVNRATAGRWLAAIREGLFEATRARLVSRLALDDSADADSILRLIDSELDVSIGTLIRLR